MRTYEVIDSIETDIAEQVRYSFTNNELPSDRDALIDELRESMRTAVDNSLIYTRDILELWEDAGHPEPFEFGMADTISDSITNAVYEHLLNEAEDVIFDAADEALADLQSKILDGDIFFSWSEAVEDEPSELMRDLREAEDPEDIFDALANFRAEVEI